MRSVTGVSIRVGASIGLALLVSIAAGAGVFAEPRNDLMDRSIVHDTDSGLIVVLALDEPFMRAAEFDGLAKFAAVVEIVKQARTVLIEPDAVQAGESFAHVDLLGQSADDEAAIFFKSLPSVLYPLVRGDVGPPRAGSSLPVLQRAVTRSVLAEASQATGFATPVPVDPRQPRRTIPLVAEYPTGGQPVTVRPCRC